MDTDRLDPDLTEALARGREPRSRTRLRVDALADGDLTFNYQTQPVVIELKRANGDRFTFSAPTHVATRALLAESDAILRRSVGRVATV